MSDEWEPDLDTIRALIDEIEVEAIDGDRDWSHEIWLPEYAEPVLGTVIFERVYDRIAALPGVERLAWEDRERFLVKLHRGERPEPLRDGVVEIVRSAVTEAGHELP